MNVADQIRNSIAEGQLDEPLQLAIEFLRGRDSLLHNECLLHKGRVNKAKSDSRIDIIDAKDANRIFNGVWNALLNEVVPVIERLEAAPAAPEPQTIPLNAVPNHAAPHAHAATADSSEVDHAAAQRLVQDFLQLLATYEVENAAWRAAPFLHRSLLQQGGMMQPQFKQNNFYSAHQRFRTYRQPVSFAKMQATNRTAIGGLLDRDEGQEYVYTLEKTVENGGMPGTVRVFFPKDGSGPKITLVSF